MTQSLVFSQKPREVDLENDPVDWSDPAKIIVLVVIPAFMLITGLILRQRNLKKKQGKSE